MLFKKKNWLQSRVDGLRGIFKKNFFFTVLFLVSCPAFSYSFFSENLTNAGLDLYVSNKKVQLDSPFVIKDDKLFLPLQDFLPILNATLTYLRKDDIYELEILHSKQLCAVIPNSREFWIGTTVYYFSASTFEYQNQIYLPLEDFLNLLGVRFKKEDVKLFLDLTPINTPKLTQPQKEPQDAQETILFQTEQPKLLYLDLFNKLPVFEDGEEPSLTFGKYVYPLKKRFLYHNSIFYIDMTYILRNEHYRVELSSSNVTLQKDAKLCIFSTTQNQIIVKKNAFTSVVQSMGPVLQKKDRYYIPFLSFLSVFDLTFFWDGHRRTLTITRKIQEVKLIKKNNQYILKIMAGSPITNYQILSLDWPNRIQILLSNMIPIFMTQPATLQSGPITHFTAFQDKATTILELGIDELPSFSPQTTATGLDFIFNTTVTALTQTDKGSHLFVSIHGSAPLDYQKPFIENSKFILDIPNAVCELAPSMNAKGSFYHSIRTSQYQINPLTTRVVFDLKTKDVDYVIKKGDGNSIDIDFFSKTGILSKPVAPKTPSEKAVARIESIKTIIILDPGHGGSDPGAMTENGESEKKLTLDVALKLQKMLQSSQVRVILTRDSDKLVSLAQRVELANRYQADLFISLHFNSFVRDYANGIETYYYKSSDKLLTSIIHKELVKSLGLRNNGMKEARMYVNRYAEMPTVLVEPLYLSNPREYHLAMDPVFRQKLAETLCRGIKNYLDSSNSEKGL